MKKFTAVVTILLGLMAASNAEAAKRKQVAQFHPECNVTMPCIGAPVPFTQERRLTKRELRQARRAQRYENVPFGAPMYPPETQRAFLKRGQRQNYTQSYVIGSEGMHFSGGNLLSKARQYMGGNPTGWHRVWCGRFMAMIAPRAAARIRNPNMARDWAHAGPRYSGCTVGAVAVLSRGRRGGHVGVVSACTPQGPQIVSGNHGRKVGEGIYSSRRVLAYVDASS